MSQNYQEEKWSWMSTSSQILHERPERLQYLVMQIAEKHPEMGCYASDLARLRMSGIVMENMLFMIWKADSLGQIDQLVSQSCQYDHPCSGALTVLADIIKQFLATEDGREQVTVH
jgi:hypothetical protein